MPNYVKIGLVKRSTFVLMKAVFKYLLFIVLSIFLSGQLSASSVFSSIEKKGTRVYELANSVDDLMNGGKLFGKFSRGKFLEVISKKQKLFGGNKILLSGNRTTTITGSLSDVNVVARRGESLSGVTKMGQNVGGINILRSPKWSKIITKHTRNGVTDWAKVSDEFWNTVNKPWLDDAIKRGDNFRFVSDPLNEVAKYVNKNGKFILDVNGNKIKSIFWREFEYLKSKGYRLMSDGTLSK